MTGTIRLRRSASSSQAAKYALSAMTAAGFQRGRPGLPVRKAAALEQWPDADQVVALPAGQVERDWPAAAVAAQVELGREAVAAAGIL